MFVCLCFKDMTCEHSWILFPDYQLSSVFIFNGIPFHLMVCLGSRRLKTHPRTVKTASVRCDGRREFVVFLCSCRHCGAGCFYCQNHNTAVLLQSKYTIHYNLFVMDCNRLYILHKNIQSNQNIQSNTIYYNQNIDS